MSPPTPDDPRRRRSRAAVTGTADPTGSAGPTGPADAPDSAKSADALDTATAAAGDAHIPMLTDVLATPRYAGTALPASLDDVSWPDLSLRVQHNVMERLMRRSEAMLDTPLRETLNAVLDRHLHSLHSDLHDTLSLLVRDLVSRAVADELARVQDEIQHRRPDGD